MRGKRAKQIRKAAQIATVGEPPNKAKAAGKRLKAAWFRLQHPARPPAPTPVHHLSRASSIARAQQLAAKYEPIREKAKADQMARKAAKEAGV